MAAVTTRSVEPPGQAGRPSKSARDGCGRFVKGHVGESQGGGRRGTLTAQRAARIVELVASGNFMTVAARAAGVTPRTLRKWLQRGEADDAKGRRTVHARLFGDVRQAVAESEVRAVRNIKLAAEPGEERTVRRVAKPVMKDGQPVVVRDAAGDPVLVDGKVQYVEHVTTETEIRRLRGDWRADAFLLASRHHTRYAKSRRLDHGGVVRHRHMHLHMIDEDKAIAARVMSSRLRRAEPAPAPSQPRAITRFDQLLPSGNKQERPSGGP